jgi:hypothetical protein
MIAQWFLRFGAWGNFIGIYEIQFLLRFGT